MEEVDFLHSLYTQNESIIKSLSEQKIAIDVLLNGNISRKLSLRDWAKEWLVLYKKPKCKFNYYNQIVRYLELLIYPIFGDVNMNDIDTFALQKFMLSIKSDNTRTKLGAIFSELFRRAYEQRIVAFNVYLGVDFNRYESPKLGALTHREQLDLLNIVHSNHTKYVFIFLLLVVGLRQGEALALTSADFDFEEKEVKITKSLERKTMRFVPPKTKAGYRTIPIEDELIDLLKPLIAHIKKDERIFKFRHDNVQKYLSKVLFRIGTNYSGHILRHTFITNCYELGVPPHIVQIWAGHSKVEQADTYLSLRKSKDFIRTPVVEYMLKLKGRYVKTKF